MNKSIMFSNTKIIVRIIEISILTKIMVIMIFFHNRAALSQGAVSQEHLHTLLGGAGLRPSNLPVTSRLRGSQLHRCCE